MSYVVAAPDMLATAAADLEGIRSALSAANAAAAAPTSGVLAAGADEVSAALASLFSGHGGVYQAPSAEAASFHQQSVQAMSVGGSLYAGAVAASASVIGGPLEAMAQPALQPLAAARAAFANINAGVGNHGNGNFGNGNNSGNDDSGLFQQSRRAVALLSLNNLG